MIASYSIRSRIDREMKWNTGPQFNTEASHFSIPTGLWPACLLLHQPPRLEVGMVWDGVSIQLL